MSDILIKNAKIVNEGNIFKSDILISGDLIVDIAENNNPVSYLYTITNGTASTNQQVTTLPNSLLPLLQGGGLGIYGDVLFNEVRDKFALLGGLVGPIGVTTADVLMAIKHGTRLEFSKASKSAYDAVTAMIPFYNLFYIKSAFDYMIGYQIMETIKPGILERIENRMEKDYNQHFLFTKPSKKNKGF